MYDLAKKARSGMKSKAQRLAGEKDRKTDSSDWSPAEPLNADVKTGMRPVSRRAYKKGGKVMGCDTPVRADRKARKAGGKVTAKVEQKGEQPMVDRYVNRDLKKANEYRDGKKHVGGMKHGGRAKKQEGGATGSKDYQQQLIDLYNKMEANVTEQQIKDLIARDKFGDKKGNIPLPPRREYKNYEELMKAYPEKKSSPPASSRRVMPPVDQMGNPTGMKKGGKVKHSDVKEDKALIKKMIKPSAMKEDRAKKMDGGPMMADPRLGIVKNKAMEFGQNMVTPGLKKGGRAEKADGGTIRQRFNQEFAKQRAAGAKKFTFEGKEYTTELYKPTTGPSTRGRGETKSPRVLKKNITVEFGAPDSGMPKTDQLGNPNSGMKKGGRIAKQIGGALGRGMGMMGRPNMGRPGMAPPPMPSPVRGGGMSRPAMPGKPNMGGGMMQRPVTPGPGTTPIGGGRPGDSMNFIGGSQNFDESTGQYRPGTGPTPIGALPTLTPAQQALGQQQIAQNTQQFLQNLPQDQRQQYEASLSMPRDQYLRAYPMEASPATLPPMSQSQAMANMGVPQMPMARKSGGRVARAFGGETTTKSKTKTVERPIQIFIQSGKDQPESMVPEPNSAPMGMPPMPAPAAPASAPMGGGTPPSAPMLGGAPGGPPPMGMPPMPPDAMMPPMGRKSGGRVTKVAKSYKDMEAGAGSGEGRLQKTDIAKRVPKPSFEKGVNPYEGRGYPNKVLGATGGRTARKEGGKVYRSYKDMDAGAGSGKGRLEKTEIQARKK